MNDQEMQSFPLLASPLIYAVHWCSDGIITMFTFGIKFGWLINEKDQIYQYCYKSCEKLQGRIIFYFLHFSTAFVNSFAPPDGIKNW